MGKPDFKEVTGFSMIMALVTAKCHATDTLQTLPYCGSWSQSLEHV